MHYLLRAVLGVLLLAALVLTACGSSNTNSDNPVKASGVLRVGTESVYSPFSYHDPATGELTGYDVDVARAVGEKIGVNVEFVETPSDSIFAALEANRFDVVANEVTITPERQQKYDLSEPYSVGEGVIVTRTDDNSIKSLADLKGKVTAQTTTSNWAQIARDAGARVEAVEASPRRSRCSTRVGSTRSSTTASPSTPTWPRPTTRRSRSPHRPARRVSRASPPARTAACCPSSTSRSTS